MLFACTLYVTRFLSNAEPFQKLVEDSAMGFRKRLHAVIIIFANSWKKYTIWIGSRVIHSSTSWSAKAKRKACIQLYLTKSKSMYTKNFNTATPLFFYQNEKNKWSIRQSCTCIVISTPLTQKKAGSLLAVLAQAGRRSPEIILSIKSSAVSSNAAFTWW